MHLDECQFAKWCWFQKGEQPKNYLCQKVQWPKICWCKKGQWPKSCYYITRPPTDEKLQVKGRLPKWSKWCKSALIFSICALPQPQISGCLNPKKISVSCFFFFCFNPDVRIACQRRLYSGNLPALFKYSQATFCDKCLLADLIFHSMKWFIFFVCCLSLIMSEVQNT